MARTTKDEWVKLGSVGVDSGKLLICDPSYIDSFWKSGEAAPGHNPVVLTEQGRNQYRHLEEFEHTWPFDWGSYEDTCPELDMSINAARDAGIVEDVPHPKVRTFGYAGCCSAGQDDEDHQLNFSQGLAGVGVAFSSGHGDGCYEVYGRRNEDGRIVEVRIFMGTDPELLRKLGVKE